MEDIKISNDSEELDLKYVFLRYFSFWPIFLISIIFGITVAYLTARYSNYKYVSTAKIEILDKAQDSEMALPTSMTVFNRSMINLDNEIGLISSFDLHKKVSSSLKSNVFYFKLGKLKNTQKFYADWFSDYSIDFNVETDLISQTREFTFEFKNNNLIINDLSSSKTFKFDNYSTNGKNHDLPFEIEINPTDTEKAEVSMIKFIPFKKAITSMMNSISIKEIIGSDQLSLSIEHFDKNIADEYLDNLISAFDRDGIIDRQLEYKRTMEFVDSRSVFLEKEVNELEKKLLKIKQENNLSDIATDANSNINQKNIYNSELFETRSQLDLVNLLESSINFSELNLLPPNIGLDNNTINNLINEYNIKINEFNKTSEVVGPNNLYLNSLKKQINDVGKSIDVSISNYKNSLKKTIANLEIKEDQFVSQYKLLPAIETQLRSINRELAIKEQLFLLLLQKKEEAAINYAVVKPTIKVIDYSRSVSDKPSSPDKAFIYFISIITSFLSPLLYLVVKFSLDTKIHSKKELSKKLGKNSVIVGEIPFMDDAEKMIFSQKNKNNNFESFRMLKSNVEFANSANDLDDKLILVTSSIKGEGKTLVAANYADVLTSSNEKVLLIGCDMRNPQLHRYFDLDKDNRGLTDMISKNDMAFDNYIFKGVNENKKLDLLISGTIPPNPNELISSPKFKNILNDLKNSYDKIVIDSPPCLIVSDTLSIVEFVDTCIYVFRANYTEKPIIDFINDLKDNNKINNMMMVLNAVGKSAEYGYKYSYTYGYNYTYKYSYNYGYEYGYGEDK